MHLTRSLSSTRHRYGNALDHGGATLAVKVIGTGVSAVTVDDRGDGTYTLSFSGSVAGDCKLIVRMDNHEMPSMVITFVKASDEAQKASDKAQDPVPQAGAA